MGEIFADWALPRICHILLWGFSCIIFQAFKECRDDKIPHQISTRTPQNPLSPSFVQAFWPQKLLGSREVNKLESEGERTQKAFKSPISQNPFLRINFLKVLWKWKQVLSTSINVSVRQNEIRKYIQLVVGITMFWMKTEYITLILKPELDCYSF